MKHRRARLVGQHQLFARVMHNCGECRGKGRERHRVFFDQRVKPQLAAQPKLRVLERLRAMGAAHRVQIEVTVSARRFAVAGEEVLQPGVVQHDDAGRGARDVKDGAVEGGVVADIVDVGIRAIEPGPIDRRRVEADHREIALVQDGVLPRVLRRPQRHLGPFPQCGRRPSWCDCRSRCAAAAAGENRLSLSRADIGRHAPSSTRARGTAPALRRPTGGP